MELATNGEKTLRELGLTLSQARVYFALLKLGSPSTVKTISAFSKVARQDVYRTLTDLQELSLVEMVVGNPASFKPIPLKEAIAILMGRKNQQTRVLLAEATELCKLLPSEKEASVHYEPQQFVLIPKKEVIFRRIQKIIDSSNESILIYATWREFNQLLFALQESWKQALDKGVEVRWIIEDHGENQAESNSLTKMAQTLVRDRNFRIKTQTAALEARFSIYDNKELFISVLNTPNAIDSPALWTNNPAVVRLLKDYFETKWQLTADYDLDRIVA